MNKIKYKPKEILINILNKYNKSEDQVLFQLKHKYMLHVDLSNEYPYLKEGSLNEKYVKECTKKAMEVFKSMKMNNNLLVVYDDIYNSHGITEKDFVESTLENTIQYDNYKLKWKFPDNEDIYTCNRYLYQFEKVNIQKLFKEIILSDIGGNMKLCSAIFIIDIDIGNIFHLYDDRGLYIYFPKEEDLINVGGN